MAHSRNKLAQVRKISNKRSKKEMAPLQISQSYDQVNQQDPLPEGLDLLAMVASVAYGLDQTSSIERPPPSFITRPLSSLSTGSVEMPPLFRSRDFLSMGPRTVPTDLLLDHSPPNQIIRQLDELQQFLRDVNHKIDLFRQDISTNDDEKKDREENKDVDEGHDEEHDDKHMVQNNDRDIRSIPNAKTRVCNGVRGVLQFGEKTAVLVGVWANSCIELNDRKHAVYAFIQKNGFLAYRSSNKDKYGNAIWGQSPTTSLKGEEVIFNPSFGWQQTSHRLSKKRGFRREQITSIHKYIQETLSNLTQGRN